MTLTYSASLAPPERGHSLGLWGGPCPWLFSSCPFLVYLCFPLAAFTFSAFQVDLLSQGFLPHMLCLSQCWSSGSKTAQDPELDPHPAPLHPRLVKESEGWPAPAPCFPGVPALFFAHPPFSTRLPSRSSCMYGTCCLWGKTYSIGFLRFCKQVGSSYNCAGHRLQARDQEPGPSPGACSCRDQATPG